ncbi:uncharacterized protein LOC106642762 [Copidosoma floridanum]|uniref:uncharacterized protein LOC106642762 n=1 Tax=Copidosoma floridanum TaxID=29053 RepID=UPI0006C950A8|nr:uncharacterized protein LOC106642762 [Copidosoma floridanum]
MEHDQCSKHLNNYILPQDQFCTLTSKYSIYDYPGSPLIERITGKKDVLQGITISPFKTDRKYQAFVFTRVSDYLDWIKDTIHLQTMQSKGNKFKLKYITIIGVVFIVSIIIILLTICIYRKTCAKKKVLDVSVETIVPL